MDSQLEKLNDEYLQLMIKAHEAAGKNKDVSIIRNVQRLAQEIGLIEK